VAFTALIPSLLIYSVLLSVNTSNLIESKNGQLLKPSSRFLQKKCTDEDAQNLDAHDRDISHEMAAAAKKYRQQRRHPWSLKKSYNGLSTLKRPAPVSTAFGAFKTDTLSSIIVPGNTPHTWDQIFDQSQITDILIQPNLSMWDKHMAHHLLSFLSRIGSGGMALRGRLMRFYGATYHQTISHNAQQRDKPFWSTIS
jgi:hypothetical protein